MSNLEGVQLQGMGVWSIGILSSYTDVFWGPSSWPQQCHGLAMSVGRAPGPRTPSNQVWAHNQLGRCSNSSTTTPARPRGFFAGRVCGYRDPTLGLDSRRSGESLWVPDFWQRQCREVLWLNTLYQLGWVDAQRATLDSEIPGRPAGDDGIVTGGMVNRLCCDGHLAEAVEGLGVLVQKDCCISKSLFCEVLKKCVLENDLVLGIRMHALMVRMGYQAETFMCNFVLRLYASNGRLKDAMDVFEVVDKPDAFMWSSVISAHVKQGRAREAIALYRRMCRSDVKADSYVFVAVLKACARGGDLKSGQEVHAAVLATGVEPGLFVYSCLVDMYAKCGSLEDAKRLFDGLGRKDVVTWTAMIAGYSQRGMGQEALRLYSAMEEEGDAVPNAVTFVCLLQACASVGISALEKGKHLHARIREQGHQSDVFVANSLVNMYAKCGSLEDAQRMFDGLKQKNVVTWTAMIAGYSQRGKGLEALDVYSAMQDEGIAVPNSVTFMCLLQACASVGTSALEEGKQLHAQIREAGYQADAFVSSSLVNMYAKCGSLEDAQRLFDGLCQKDVVIWTAMIAGYSQRGMGQEALRLYSAMEAGGMAIPNSVTFVCLLQACASVGPSALEKGKQLHCEIRERGHQADVFVASSLVNMYAKCGSLDEAQKLFDRLDDKNVVTWTAMIAGYSQQGRGHEALILYNSMQEGGVAVPDTMTFVCLLQACASVGTLALEKGKQLHAQIRKQGHQADVFAANSLVNMYAKCGSLEDAKVVFDGLAHKDVVTWNAMIAGYCQQRMEHEALRLFSAMQEGGAAAPDSVTYVCLLQACANVAALYLGRLLHAQIVEQGLQGDQFVAGSLINMYGKCGSMVDAQQVFDVLHEKDFVVWNALIAGYACQGDSEVVFDLVQRMKADGLPLDSIAYLSLLTVCSHAGLVHKGWEFFQSMNRDNGIVPTEDHYTCMVDLLGRAGHLYEALAVVRTMPLQPNRAVWHTLLGACRKWSNVEVGLHSFNEAIKIDDKDAAAYVLMSNIFTGAQMWEQARKVQAMRERISAWKQPGQSSWADKDGLVHSFTVGDEKHGQSRGRPK